MIKQNEPLQTAKALSKLMDWCSRAERNEHDVRAKLLLWGVNKDEWDGIVKQLHEERFLDNERFLQAFVKDKLKYNKWGSGKIGHHLRAKGFSDAEIGKSLSNSIVKTEYEEIVAKEIIKKNKQLKEEEAHRKAKLLQFGASRGYEMELVMRCINSILNT